MPESTATIIIQGFLEAILIVIIASTINRDLKLKKEKIILYAVILSALSHIMNATQFAFHLILTLPLMVAIYLLLKRPSRRKIIDNIIDIVFAIMMISLLQAISSLIAGVFGVDLMEYSITRLLIVVCLIIIFSILSSKNQINAFFEKYYFPLRKALIITIVFFAVMIIILSELFILYGESLSSKVSLYILIVVFGYLISSALMGAALFSAIKSTMKSKLILEYGEHQNKIISEYRKKIHEFNNHIQVIRSLNQNEDVSVTNNDVEEYVEKLIDLKNKKDDVTIIEDSVFISAVLYQKQGFAAQNHIQFNITGINASAKYSIPDTDLLDILNNLIDNAFEEVQQLAPANRVVFLSFQKNLIEIVNSVSKSTYKNNSKHTLDQGFTTKGPGRGAGLSIVRSIADRHNIQVQTDWEKGKIVFRLIFPNS